MVWFGGFGFLASPKLFDPKAPIYNTINYPLKTKHDIGTSPIFNRRYIFLNAFFPVVMLVNSGVQLNV